MMRFVKWAKGADPHTPTSAPGDFKSEHTSARDALIAVGRDRRFCANCFRQFRDIEDPPSWSPPGATGKQFTTPESTRGAVDDKGLAWVPGDMDAPPGTPEAEGRYSVEIRGTRPGLKCSCGVGNHSTLRRPVPRHVAKRRARRLSDVLRGELYRDYLASTEGREKKAHAWEHDRAATVEGLNRLYDNSPRWRLEAETVEHEHGHGHGGGGREVWPDPLFLDALTIGIVVGRADGERGGGGVGGSDSDSPNDSYDGRRAQPTTQE